MHCVCLALWTCKALCGRFYVPCINFHSWWGTTMPSLSTDVWVVQKILSGHSPDTEIFVYFYLATLPTYLCSSAEYCCWSSWSFIADDFSCSCMAFSSPCVIHTDCSALCRSCSRVVMLSASAVRAVSAEASSCCRRLISLGSVETRLRVSWEHNVKKQHDQKINNKKQGWEECLF